MIFLPIVFVISDVFAIAVPNKVRDEKAYSYGADWVYLRWKQPYPPTGEIEKYILKFAGKEKEVRPDAECELWEGLICGKIEPADKLASGREYYIKVGTYIILV